jgi:hypothetical protein
MVRRELDRTFSEALRLFALAIFVNAIFTTCVGYDIEAIRPFIETCQKFTNASLYILHAKLSNATLAHLQERAVHLMPWPDEPTKEACTIARWGHYLQLIQNEQLNFSRAMFTDIRDVLFQADPFARPEPYHIKVFEEEALFRDSGRNQRWLRRCSEDMLSPLMDKPIICAGVTLASYDGAIDYLKHMASACQSLSERFFGADQAVLNHLVYGGKISGVEIVPNRRGEVQTMALQDQFLLDGHGRVLNADGSVCPILHQYDRHAIFGKYLLQNQGFAAIHVDEAARKVKQLERVLNSRSRLTKRWLRLLLRGAPATK